MSIKKHIVEAVDRNLEKKTDPRFKKWLGKKVSVRYKGKEITGELQFVGNNAFGQFTVTVNRMPLKGVSPKDIKLYTKQSRFEDLEEENVTGAGEAYDTPHAFSKSKKDDVEVFDYKTTKKSNRHFKEIEEGSQTGAGEKLGGYKAFQGTGKIKHKNSGSEETMKSKRNFKAVNESNVKKSYEDAIRMLNYAIPGALSRKKWDIIYDDIKQSGSKNAIKLADKISVGTHLKDKELVKIYHVLKSEYENKFGLPFVEVFDHKTTERTQRNFKINESFGDTYNTSGLRRSDLESLLNFLEMKNVDYSMDRDELEFDSTELDRRGQDILNKFLKSGLRVESKKISKFKKMAKALNEISYNDYKKDETATPKQKVNRAIHEMNRKLREIETMIRHNSKLKTEMGVDGSQYWKSSRTKMEQISERMLNIAKQLREFGN